MLAILSFNISTKTMHFFKDILLKRKGKKLMPLNYGCGEEFYEFCGQRREQTFQFWRK